MGRPRKTPIEDQETTKLAVKKASSRVGVLNIQKKQFDPNTGKPLFKAFDCTYATKRDFEQFLQFPNGHKINEVKLLPDGWPQPEDKLMSK